MNERTTASPSRPKVWIDEPSQEGRQITAQAAPTPSQAAAAQPRPAPLGSPTPQAPQLRPGGAPSTKVGRNDLCTCGSGKKYKRCCGA
jgi:uncharacterized protein YecA (UPF0149 family)